MGVAQAGGSCAVVKQLGNSLAIEWVAAPEINAAQAMSMVKQKLVAEGYRKRGQDVHTQATTNLEHGYLVVVKSVYENARGKPRTSFGCGFSGRSAGHAEQMAQYNLSSYSWGWKPEMGYEMVESVSY
jgi:hypothetical protein